MSIAIEPDLEARLPDRYEVVNGEVVEIPPMSGFAAEVANRIHKHLARYEDTSRLGRSRMDMLFRLPLTADRSRNRRPDVAFIAFDRWPEGRPMPYRGNPVDVVPDLMIEVASPTDDAEDLLAKAHEYLEAGARLVWLVYPRLRVVYAYESPTTFRVFTAADELDGGTLLPGFRVPMVQLFPPVIPEPEPPESANGAG
jgi:Uma2 family endonuclease